MANPSAITNLGIDPAKVLDASFRFDQADRRYIDNQIRGVERHLLDSLLLGVHASWYTLDPGGVAVAAGDVVAVRNSDATGRTCSKASGAALSAAGMALGIALVAAAPGMSVPVALAGVVPNSITGLAAADSGAVRVNTSTARAEKVASFAAGDYPLGWVDIGGNLTVLRSLPGQYVAATPPPGDPADDGSVAIGSAGQIAWTPPAAPLALLHGDPGGGGWLATVPTALQYGYDGSTSQRVSGDAVQVVATTNERPVSVTVATLALNETLHIVVLVVASGGTAPGSEVWTCKAGLRGTGPGLMYSSVTREGGVDEAAWLDPVWDFSANATAKLTLTGVAATKVEWTVAPQILRTRPYDGT